MFDKTKHISSDGSANTCSKCPPFVRTHARKRFYATRQYCIVNHALVHDVVPNVQQTVLQFVNAVQLRLMHSLQDVTLAIDRIEVGATRWPHQPIWRNESRCQVLKKSHVQCRVPGVQLLVLLKG